MFHKLELTALGALLCASVGNAQTYYSVDVVNDVLCAVNVHSGVVTYLGPLQADLAVVDLAWQQGALYAQTWGSPVGNKIYQIVVDGHYLGYGLQGGTLHGGDSPGYTVGALGGLASDGTSLYLAYSISNPNNNYAGSFGTVHASWDGTITVAAPLQPIPHDIDGMGFVGGQFWGVDVISPAGGYVLYRGTSATGPITPVGGGSYDLATNPQDLEYFNNDWLVAISQTGQYLVRVNKSTGARGTVTALTGLRPGGVLNGIAMRPNPCNKILVY